MFATILSILFISLIGAGLAAILVFCESVIANYGPCEIDINEGEKTITIDGGCSLLEALVREEIYIPSACGGRGTCGYCKVKVLSGAGPLLPTETPFLEKDEIEDKIRLSCQVKVRGPMQLIIPQELLLVKQYEAVCTSIIDLTYDIKQFRFELNDDEAIDYIPGQYVQLFTPKYPGNKEEVYRAYSISSDSADKNAIELIIRRVPNGICTTWCFDHLKQGDKVRFNGPYGDFCLSQTDSPIVFIAGGSGMAPIKCILHHMKNIDCKRKAYYFFGGQSSKDQFHADLMKDFQNVLHDFTYVPVIATREDGNWDGETGLVTEAVARYFDDLSNSEGYLCGSPGMINASVKVLTELGMPDEKVYYDSFA